MIQAQELRIGNWFEHCGFYYQSTGVLENASYFTPKEDFGDRLAYLAEIKPIPLTEEILLKCGFERTITPMQALDYIDYRMNQFVCFLLPTGKLEVEFYANNNKIDERGYLTSVIYLHQLQNLFYCLCGKELEVKL